MNFGNNKVNNNNFNAPSWLACRSGRVRGVILLLFFVQFTFAQPPKREVRATWLTTVWRLDWPSKTVPEATGTNEASREAARNVQKSELLSVLDKLQAANFNTVFFQIRGMSDAFYKSKYEPWSQYLSSVRGADPGWDPLAYLIEEGHKRGIEVHAWLNPYRYSSSSESHGNLPNDYAAAHPEWLLDYGGFTKILNPGMPEVRQRICDVVADIISNYDVDGIVFDDYFYVSGITDAMDQQQFELYNPKGLSRGDWRRENVNQMVRDVQMRINNIKPYVTFGISPAGVAASSAAVAAKYGVEPSPVGSDWQYNGIYSDPLAWLNDGSIDYISPQLYWAIGHATNDFGKLSAWWSKISNHFGRHFYSSNTSTFSITELNNEITVNRNADLNGTTGSVYFRTNNIPQSTLTNFKSGSYQFPALRAVYGWKPSTTQGLVESLFLSGQNLSWNYSDNLARYSIYAVPRSNLNENNIFSTPKYLTGISYVKNFTLPAGITSATHAIAVAVYDRYGNEFSPRILGEVSATAAAVELIYPAHNANNIVLPALFTWKPVEKASTYIWELAMDEAFTKPVVSREVTQPEFYSGLQTNIKENETYFWRVKAICPNTPVSISETRNFLGSKFKITSPTDGSSNVPREAVFSWTDIGSQATYTLEISAKADFSTLVYTVEMSNTSATVPSGLLSTSTTYYARVKVVTAQIQAISERINFTTEEVFIPVPVLTSPANGSTVYGTEIELAWQVQASKGFRAELSQNPSFPTRSTTLKSVDSYTYKAVYNNLTDGTYHVRVRALNSTGLTDPSDFVTVQLINTSGFNPIENNELFYHYYDTFGQSHIVVNFAENKSVNIQIFSISGIMVHSGNYGLSDGNNIITPEINDLPKGLYLIKITTGKNTQTVRFIK